MAIVDGGGRKGDNGRAPSWGTSPLRTLLTAATLATGLAAPAIAEPRSFSLSPYLWLPGLDTSAGTAKGDFDFSLSASDVLSSLDVGFMGVAEARNGRWGLALDLIYADLSESRDFPAGAPFSRASVANRLFPLLSGLL
ncbi:MAG: hypothetical protein QM699_17265 [Amaricoccus sp.]|uniref:hypothetical protein n=1 Tax=Amaricoccus sp. TaxID=1872485 RepID=UPI0039E29C42